MRISRDMLIPLKIGISVYSTYFERKVQYTVESVSETGGERGSTRQSLKLRKNGKYKAS